MWRSHLPAVLIRALTFPILAITMAGAVHGQENEGDLVYKFSVQGVDDAATAKPVQYVLLDHGIFTSCQYIPECNCFTLASGTPLDYATLKNWVQASGHELIGDVEVSNSTLLRPPDNASER